MIPEGMGMIQGNFSSFLSLATKKKQLSLGYAMTFSLAMLIKKCIFATGN